jgi:penicillin amidase
MVRALIDTLAWWDKNVGAEPAKARWGRFHKAQLQAIVPPFGKLAVPPAGDRLFPDGFPRPGDAFSVSASGFSLAARVDKSPHFEFSMGAVQRFIVEMTPAGPVAWGALAGGNVWDAASPHFRDEAEWWRTDEVHPLPFRRDEVLKAKESHLVAQPAQASTH